MKAFLAKVWAKVKAFLLAVLPVSWTKASTLPVAIQAEVDKIHAETKVRVDALTQGHTASEVKAKVEADKANVKAVLERLLTLLDAEAAAKPKE